MQTTFRLKANFDFSVLVCGYTPKNKHVFASRLSFGRKYASYEMFS